MLRLALLASLLTCIAAAAEPLVKPATPPAGFVRVTYPLTGGDGAKGTAYSIAGFVAPSTPDKTAPGTAVKVGLCSGIPPIVTVAALKTWGYDGEAGKTFTLPSLTLVGEAKVQGKPSAVHVRFSNILLMVVKSAYGSETSALGADLMISLNNTVLAPMGQSELWMTFNEKATLKVSYPAAAVKKVGMAEDREEPEIATDPERVPLRIPFNQPNCSTLIVSLHGKPANAQARLCILEISMIGHKDAYITLPMARLYDVKIDESKEFAGAGADRVGKGFKAQIKDLRLAGGTGLGWKSPLNLNLKDLPVTVDADHPQAVFFLVPEFIKSFLKSPLLAVGSDGIPRLYGYAEKEKTVDPKAKK